ncbi:uncharacterized protein LOC113238045 [Hyposmocoma kahamanoa]|uniref:uncharacterized protein LOC113238045 n=1 Tax=Hyposmocoma kahamanoa TaxID=1477025 RepID=UPI000E6D8D08|nr:uncharacterized protein LOC113238045 [Hyposmocoma kahamanoa]
MGNDNTPVRLTFQDDLGHHTTEKASANQHNTQNVTVRPKPCQRVEDETEENNLEFNLKLIEDVDGKKVIAGDIMAELKLFADEMKSTRVEMSMFRETVLELTTTIKAQNMRIEQLENKIQMLESKLNETQKCNVSDLEDTILQLRMDIQGKDQEMLVNDVEIAGFPEVGNENSVHAVLTIARKLGVQLEDRDVVSAERVGAPRAFLDGEAPRPRPLAVRLARSHTRDGLLEAARVRRRLSTEGMGLPGATRSFYINERLSRYNRQLFQKAREVASRMNWRYVWTRGGRVYARQEQGKDRHRIQSERDFNKVFGNS